MIIFYVRGAKHPLKTIIIMEWKKKQPPLLVKQKTDDSKTTEVLGLRHEKTEDLVY